MLPVLPQVFESPAGLAEASCAAVSACGPDVNTAAAADLLASAAAALAAREPSSRAEAGDDDDEGTGWSAEALERVQAHKAAAHTVEQARPAARVRLTPGCYIIAVFTVSQQAQGHTAPRAF